MPPLIFCKPPFDHHHHHHRTDSRICVSEFNIMASSASESLLRRQLRVHTLPSIANPRKSKKDQNRGTRQVSSMTLTSLNGKSPSSGIPWLCLTKVWQYVDQKTHYTKVVFLERFYNSHMTIPINHPRWHSKRKCGIPMFIHRGWYVFPSCIHPRMINMVMKTPERDGYPFTHHTPSCWVSSAWYYP